MLNAVKDLRVRPGIPDAEILRLRLRMTRFGQVL
jgi:hypothetical protein